MIPLVPLLAVDDVGAGIDWIVVLVDRAPGWRRVIGGVCVSWGGWRIVLDVGDLA